MVKRASPAPIIVIFGEEAYQKATALQTALDALLPPDVDRTLALCPYDGSRSEEQGGPAFASVADDLATLPFLAARRVVLIREADGFIAAHRERLERYAGSPAASATLILECRSFPKNTRLYKAVVAAGGQLTECRKLSTRGAADFVVEAARALGKRIDPATAAQLVGLVGAEQGMLAAEMEKLSLYVGARPSIEAADVAELVGLSREEKIFAAMDAAGAGNLEGALRLWHQVLATDPSAVFKVVGGIAFVLRRWLAAHQLAAEGVPTHAIASKVMMYGRERELDTILRRLPPRRVRGLLAALATLDTQAKLGLRSIETGVEQILIAAAALAA